MLIGEIIKKYREENDVSQRTFASRTSLSPSYINTLEKLYNPKNGKPYSVTMDVADEIAKAMNMSLNTLLKLCEYKPMLDEYELLKNGDLRYLDLLFENQTLTDNEKIIKVEELIQNLNFYIESCKQQINLLNQSPALTIIRKDNITNFENDIVTTKEKIAGLQKMLEQLKTNKN